MGKKRFEVKGAGCYSEQVSDVRGMKVAFEEFHLWFQFALSLISAGKVSTKN